MEEENTKNYEEADAELIQRLRKNELNLDEVVKNLEKCYKGEQISQSMIVFK